MKLNIICVCFIKGRKGIFKTKEGLKLAYLAGIDRTLVKKSDFENKVTFDEQDVLILEANNQSHDIDVLLTNQWPKYIEKNTQPLVSLQIKQCNRFLSVYIEIFNQKRRII